VRVKAGVGFGALNAAEKGAKPESGKEEHIVVEHMTKRFGDFAALDDLSMTVKRGQIAVVIGGSGAGKTTLLRLLIGLERPTSGSIYIDGVDIAPLGDRAMNEVRRKFGMVFQYAALLDSLTVLDNVAFPLREHTKLKETEIREKVSEKLDILKLEGTEKKFPSQLSGGMRKRVGLARALMLDPQIIVYDEPTSGLDPLSSRMVDELIEETRDRFGVTSVVISHDMTSALKIADYVFLLSKGKLVGEGSPGELVEGNIDLAHKFLDASGIAADRLLSERHTNDAKPKTPRDERSRDGDAKKA
jgi:phospholipid/cholesterol/gamma-HCH transport system ATP-binding protein